MPNFINSFRNFLILLLFIFSANIFSQEEIPKKKFPDVDFSGFMQIGWKYNGEADALSNNEFIARRLRLGVEAKYAHYFKTEFEVDLTDEDILKDAKIIFGTDSDFQMTLGKHKMPFSRERLTSVKKLFFTDRTKIISEIDELNYAGRDFGLSAEYDHDFNDDFDAKITASIFNGNGGKIKGDNNNSKTFAERIELDFGALEFGFSASHKNDSLTAKYISATGIDFRFKENDWTLLAEFASAKKENGKIPGGYFFTIDYKPAEWSASIRFEQFFKDFKNGIDKINIASLSFASEALKNIKYSLELSGIDEENNKLYLEIFVVAEFSF